MVSYCLLAMSCTSRQPGDKPVLGNFSVMEITLTSPASCFNDVFLASNGEGKSVVGYRSIGQHDVVKSQRTFRIKSDRDSKNIASSISLIKLRSPVVVSKSFDTYHYVIIIDGKKCIDKFESDSIIRRLLSALQPYARIDQEGHLFGERMRSDEAIAAFKAFFARKKP